MLDKIKNRQSSITTKIVVIGVLVVALMIPAVFIQGLVSERKSRQAEAMMDVSQKWGTYQVVEGPVITVPYARFPITEDNAANQLLGTVHILPDELSVNGEVLPEIRSRGIFDVPLYTTDLNVSGTFSKNTSEFPVPEEQILWDQAKISMGISDIRGLREQVEMDFDGNKVTLESGMTEKQLFDSGVGVDLSSFGKKSTHEFSIDLMLNGSEMLDFVPMGKESKVTLNSAWQDPSFDGSFLPTEHEITEDGFKASWSILDVNRNYPQVWIDETYPTHESQFGVKLFMPVDHYQQTTRSVKYAILFIVLTFLAFFLVEVLNRYRIHPIQYLLVGFAIVLFYLLLLSLSEHLGFQTAYLVASVATVGMVSLYAGSMLHIRRLGYLIGLFLAVLYVFLYFLLQMEDLALVLGSVGLFIILGLVMFLTRNIDWYAMKSGE